MVRDVHFSDYIWRLFERNGAFFAKVVPEKINVQEAVPHHALFHNPNIELAR